MYSSLLQTVRWLRVFRRNGVQEDLPIVWLDALDPLSNGSARGSNDIRYLTDFHSAHSQFRGYLSSWVRSGFVKDTVLRYLLFLTQPRPCFRMVRRRSRNVFEMPRESAIPPNRIPIGTREREPLSNVPIHIPPLWSVFRYVPCMDETPDPCTFPCVNVKPPKVWEKETHLIVPTSNGGQDT